MCLSAASLQNFPAYVGVCKRGNEVFGSFLSAQKVKKKMLDAFFFFGKFEV